MRVFYLTIITFYLSINILPAQNVELGSWNILNLSYQLNEKWSFFGEAQLRSLKFYSDFHYYEYKGAVNYKIAKNDIVSFVNFYNTKRPHSSIERLTPEEAYLRKGELKRQWKAYYKKKENGFS